MATAIHPSPPSTTSALTMESTTAPATVPPVQAQYPRDEQILTFASSVHRMCTKEESALLSPCFTIIKELMESLSQAVMQQSMNAKDNSTSSTCLDTLVRETKKIFSYVTRLCNLHPLLVYAERPAVLTETSQAITNLHAALLQGDNNNDTSNNAFNSSLWINHQSRLLSLIEQSKFEKAKLLIEDDLLFKHIQASLTTPQAQKELLLILNRTKRAHFKSSVHELKDDAAREAAKQELQYINTLLLKVTLLMEHATSMDASKSSLPSQLDDKSIHTLSGPALPAWALCPISKRILIDPVTVRADCNHTISKSVFQEWLDQNNKTCPVCGTKLKALYAKANPQLQWKIQELENERSMKTIAHHPIITTTTSPNALRRFSTGEFTSRRTVVDTNTKSAAAPMALRGEGLGKQTGSPLLIQGDSVANGIDTDLQQDSNDSYEVMMQVLTHGHDNRTMMRDDSISTLGAPTELDGHSLEGFSSFPNDSRRSLTSIVEKDDNNNTTAMDNAMARDQMLPETVQQMLPLMSIHNKSNSAGLQRQQNEQTQVMDNSSNRRGRKKTPEEKAKASANTTGIQKVKEEEALHDHSEHTSSGASYVRFAPAVVTNYIEPSTEQQGSDHPPTYVDTSSKPGQTKIVASYPMVDRSKLGQNKKTKNPVKQLFKKLAGKSSNSPKPSAISSAKVTLQFNTSNSTAMTADISGSGRTQPTSDSPAGNSAHSGSGKSILKKHGKHSNSPDTQNATVKTKDRSEPPPLLPMQTR